jgi:hypothetical protein
MVLLPAATIGSTTEHATTAESEPATPKFATNKSPTKATTKPAAKSTSKFATKSLTTEPVAKSNVAIAATAKSSTESSARLVAQGSVASLMAPGCDLQPTGIRTARRVAVPARLASQPTT